jgi:hypothetical protein
MLAMLSEWFWLDNSQISGHQPGGIGTGIAIYGGST